MEDIADRLRDVDAEADLALLFVEAEDTYLVILRLDEGEDLRVFGSDAAFAEESRYGTILLGEVEEPVLELDEPATSDEGDEGDEEPASSPPPDADPVGDAEILADLGVPGSRLLELCAHEGLLPSDVTAEICQAMGCGDEVEELREA